MAFFVMLLIVTSSMTNFPQFSYACKSTCKSKSDCEDCDCGTTFAVPICFFDLCECVDAKRGLLSPSPRATKT
nr:hypothetical protein [Tanacetum cinerariifolium]